VELTPTSRAVPNDKIGVYSVWRHDRLVYVGMVDRAIGRALTLASQLLARGQGFEAAWLRMRPDAGRETSSASTYSTAWSCPPSTASRLKTPLRGRLSLDGLTRQLIRQSPSYQFTLMPDAATARAVEMQIQREGLAGKAGACPDRTRAIPGPSPEGAGRS
jgi:hypothetical protein